MQYRDDEMTDNRLDFAWEEDEPRRRRGGPPPSRSQQQRRRRKRKRKGKSYTALIVSLVLLLVVGVGVYWGIGQMQKNQSVREFLAADWTASDQGDEIDFKVNDGDGGTAIGVNLLKADVVKSRTAFVNACNAKATACKAIQPGLYKVKKHSPAKSVLDILADPKNKVALKFTITEGLSVIQTLNKLAEQTKLPLADFQAAVKDPTGLGIPADWYKRDDGKGAANTLAATHPEAVVEGFLFPDTYNYDPTATAKDILKQMVAQFLQVATDVGLASQATKLGYTPYELMIVASIAQDEGNKPDDFGKIARVIYNRLNGTAASDPMRLGMDSTENYWLELNGKPTKSSGGLGPNEINDPNNPYNTHGKDGLPLGPISNPGKDALAAAANPVKGSWLYFVAIDKNGTTVFANTYSEHCSNINKAIANGVSLEPC